MIDVNKVAQATAVVGYDLMTGSKAQQTSYNRVLRGIGLTGSAAIGDCDCEFYIETVFVGHIYNTKLLVGNKDDIIPQNNLFIPAGALLHAYAKTQPTTNAVFMLTDTEKI